MAMLPAPVGSDEQGSKDVSLIVDEAMC